MLVCNGVKETLGTLIMQLSLCEVNAQPRSFAAKMVLCVSLSSLSQSEFPRAVAAREDIWEIPTGLKAP